MNPQLWPAPASFSGDPPLPPLGLPRFTNSCNSSPSPPQFRSPSQLPRCARTFPFVAPELWLSYFVWEEQTALDFGSGWKFVVWRSRGGADPRVSGRTAEVWGEISRGQLDRGFLLSPPPVPGFPCCSNSLYSFDLGR